ncbi:hypothetical protein [Cryobacterium suzukii]|uniref:hypothetical protein n=1 Tax=Cryobacterium suzukii TaxID=1259198 RepID=UPI00141A7991|nr:hypothetical protein [Cryobacterium suzukii]
MNDKITTVLIPGVSALFVAAFFLFAALWVNGNSLPHCAQHCNRARRRHISRYG